MSDKSLNPFHPTKHYAEKTSDSNHDGTQELIQQVMNDDNRQERSTSNLSHLSAQHGLEVRKNAQGLTQAHRYHHPLPANLAREAANNNTDDQIDDDKNSRTSVSLAMRMNQHGKVDQHKQQQQENQQNRE